MKKILFFALFLIGVLLIGFVAYYSIFAKGSFEYTFDNTKKTSQIKSTSGRTNFFIIGVDTRDKKYLQTGTLTDTLIIASVDFNNKNIKLLSVPRDYYVDKYQSKINEIYTLKDYNSLQESIEDILGIKIHYNAFINFSAFEKIIDALGGVSIDNPYTFTDYFYPKFGWENETCGIDIEKLKKEKEESGESLSEQDFPCRYETISYRKGLIKLNGAEALKYARSRHSGDLAQGSDFARAKRQHLVIMAVKDSLLSGSTLTNPVKIKDLFFAFQDLVNTNLSTEEFINLVPKASSISDFTIDSAVLTNSGNFDEGGVLIQGQPDLYGGRYVLVPKEKDIVKSFVTNYLYGESTKNTDDK